MRAMDLSDVIVDDFSPTVWAAYLALETPKTLNELCELSGNAESTVRRRLNQLAAGGLVEVFNDGATRLWRRAVELPEPMLAAVSTFVAGERSPAHGHRLLSITPVQVDGVWRAPVSCRCGWATDLSALHEARLRALAEAEWRRHARGRTGASRLMVSASDGSRAPIPPPAEDQSARRPLPAAQIGALVLAMAAAVVVIVWAVSRPGEDSADPAASPEMASSPTVEPPPWTTSPNPAAEPSSERPVPEPIPEPEPDPNASKVRLEGAQGTYYASESTVGWLTTAAAIYNYTIGRDEEGATGVAIVICERIAFDGWTWEEQIADDISVGAPPSDAECFTDYLRNTFCPEIGL